MKLADPGSPDFRFKRSELRAARPPHALPNHPDAHDKHPRVPSLRPAPASPVVSRSLLGRTFADGDATATRLLLRPRRLQRHLLHRPVQRVQRGIRVQRRGGGYLDFSEQLGRARVVDVRDRFDDDETHSSRIQAQAQAQASPSPDKGRRVVRPPRNATDPIQQHQHPRRDAGLFAPPPASLHLDRLLPQVFIHHGLEHGPAHLHRSRPWWIIVLDRVCVFNCRIEEKNTLSILLSLAWTYILLLRIGIDIDVENVAVCTWIAVYVMYGMAYTNLPSFFPLSR